MTAGRGSTAGRRPSFGRISNILSRLPVRASSGPVPARDLLFGALTTAAQRHGDRRWAVDHPPLAVAVDADGTVSLADLAAAARRLAAVLHAEGLTRGDRCVVWLAEPLDVLLAVTALTGLGVVPVTFSAKLDAALVAETLATVPCRLSLLAARHRGADLGRLGVAIDRVLAWERVTATGADGTALPAEGVAREPAEPYLVTHTSGTTGVPKLAVHTVRSFFEQADMQRRVIGLMRLRGHLAAAVSPVHVRTLSGYLGVLRSTADISLVVCKAEETGSISRMLRRWRPAYLETHPNTFVLWEDLAATGAMESVRLFLATFDAVHPRTIERILAGSRRRHPMFVELYAQTECGPLANRIWVGGGRRAGRRLPAEMFGHGVGWPVPGYARIRVVDGNGVAVPVGRPGRIVARTSGRFAGYLNVPELYARNLTADGWWDTGDYGSFAPDGQLHLLDRQSERLSQARSAVGLEDILLQRLPDLTEVVVMEIDGRLVPVVTSRGNTPIAEAAWADATRGLPVLAPPAQLDWHDIPRTATGKVRRQVLRQQIAGTTRYSSKGIRHGF